MCKMATYSHSNDASSVVEITSLKVSSKQQVVPPNNNGKAFFVFYYWKQCGHCEHFKPTYLEMSRALSDTVFYKLESEYIDEALEIASYPTVVLYNKDGKEVKRIVGDHTDELDLFQPVLQKVEETHDMVSVFCDALVVEITPENVSFLFDMETIPFGTLICVWSVSRKTYLSPLKVIKCPQKGKCKTFMDGVYCHDIYKCYTFSYKNGDKFFKL